MPFQASSVASHKYDDSCYNCILLGAGLTQHLGTQQQNSVLKTQRLNWIQLKLPKLLLGNSELRGVEKALVTMDIYASLFGRLPALSITQ